MAGLALCCLAARVPGVPVPLRVRGHMETMPGAGAAIYIHTHVS